MADTPEVPAGQKPKAFLFVMSGDFEKLFAAFSIAVGAAASNMDVKMLFTFWGYRALKKNVRTGGTLMARMIGVLERGDLEKADPGKYRFMGLGRWMFKRMIAKNNVAGLAELRQLAIDLGVGMYCCDTTAAVMEVPREKLIDCVVGSAGVGWLVEQAREADFTYFI